MIDINTEIFKRYKPQNKLAMVEKLTDGEALLLSTDTVKKIVREVGDRDERWDRERQAYVKHGPRKAINHIPWDDRGGNDWNSNVNGLRVDPKTGIIHMSVYIQYYNTDATQVVRWGDLMRADYRGSVTYSDAFGGTNTSYYTYDRKARASVARSILRTYVKRKYNIKDD